VYLTVLKHTVRKPTNESRKSRFTFFPRHPPPRYFIKNSEENTMREEKSSSHYPRDDDDDDQDDDQDEYAGDENTGLLSDAAKNNENNNDKEEEEESDEGKKREEESQSEDRSSTRRQQQQQTSISARQTFYPNVPEDVDDDANCAVGVPVLADGSIDYSAYERGQRDQTTRDYARVFAESEGNQDVSVLLEDPTSSSSSSPNVVELQSYSTGLFDCALDPLNFLKNFLCVPWGVGEYARDTAQGECFPTALSITMGNLLLNNLCFPMGCFATASCIHSSNAVAEHRLGIFDKTDLATAMCCAPCVVSRMQREIQARKALGVMPSREELMLRFPNHELDDWDSLNNHQRMRHRDFVPPRRVRMVHRRGNMVGRML